MRLLITGITMESRLPFETTLVELLEYWRQRLPARTR